MRNNSLLRTMYLKINQIYSYMKKFLMFLSVVLALGTMTTACHDHNDDVTTIVPPKTEVSASTLSGVVTDMKGKAIAGATLKVGTIVVVTAEDGSYSTEVEPGKHIAMVEAAGFQPAQTDITVSATVCQFLTWNPVLPQEITATINVSNAAEDNTGEVESEALNENEQHGQVNIEVEVPANTVPQGVQLTISPVYTEENAEAKSQLANGKTKGTRATNTSNEMLIGATVQCSNASVVPQNDIEVKFDLDASLASSVKARMIDQNGNWVDVTPEVNGNEVVIKTRQFTSFGLFLPVKITSTVGSQKIELSQTVWDNRENGYAITADAVDYKYNAGTRIDYTAKNKLQGLMIELLARLYGAKVTEETGTYPINMTLPAGTALVLSGTQATEALKAENGGSSVTATHYGTVTMKETTYSVDHSGGGTLPD